MTKLFKPFRRARFRLAMWHQRIAEGVSDEDAWSLDYHLARVTVAGVRRLRAAGHGYPVDFSEEHGHGGGWEAWDAILARIEAGFQAWLDEDGWFNDKPDQETKFKDGMALYGEWFGALWD